MPARPEYRWDLFITYAPSDAPWVRSYLIPSLGLPPERVRQPQDFQLGAFVNSEIEAAIKGSRYTLLVLSPAFVANEWAGFGEQLATTLGVKERAQRVIPLVLKEYELDLRIESLVRLDCTDELEWAEEVGRLRSLLELPEPQEPEIRCPYPGMTPFTDQFKDVFYGREEEIDFMLQLLRHQKFLLTLGPSGSGKSSLITAGLIPRLPESGFFKQRPWLVRSMRPGAAPWQSLTQALGGDPEDLSTTLGSLLAANPGTGRVLLVIDQFEELFAQAAPADERRFVAAIKRLREHDLAGVIVAMRADFYADLMKSDLWPVPASQRVDVGPLKGDALRRAIELPAAVGGRLYRAPPRRSPHHGRVRTRPARCRSCRRRCCSSGSGGSVSCCPTARTWRSARAGAAGLRSPLPRRPTRRWMRCSPPSRTSHGASFSGSCSSARAGPIPRRQQRVPQLRSGEADGDAFDRVLQHLSDNRLIALGGGDTPGEDRVADIAHEALFQGWPRLADWISKYRDAELRRRELDARVLEWEASGRSNERLMTSGEAQQARGWLATEQSAAVGYHGALREYVDLSRRNAQRNRRILAGLVAAVVLVTFTAITGIARSESVRATEAVAGKATAEALQAAEVRARLTAEADRRYALLQESTAQTELARQSLAVDPRESIRLALNALPSAAQPRPYEPAAENALREAMQTSLELVGLQPESNLNGLQVDADGPAIAAGSDWLRLYTRDTRHRDRARPTRTHQPGKVERHWRAAGSERIVGQRVAQRRDLQGAASGRNRVRCLAPRPPRGPVV